MGTHPRVDRIGGKNPEELVRVLFHEMWELDGLQLCLS